MSEVTSKLYACFYTRQGTFRTHLPLDASVLRTRSASLLTHASTPITDHTIFNVLFVLFISPSQFVEVEAELGYPTRDAHNLPCIPF